MQSLIYSNNGFGIKSLENIKHVLPHIFELSLNNLHFGGGLYDGKLLACSQILEELLRLAVQNCFKLMKLKLTKMNLRGTTLMENLCETLQYNKNLIFLDVSLSQLRSKELKVLSLSL